MQENSIFAVIYRIALLPGKEKRYKQLWSEVSNYFIRSKGALGSTLHKTYDGYWLAYSRWPDRATRDAAWPMNNEDPNMDLPETIRNAIIEMKASASVEEAYPPIEMELIASSENHAL